MNSKSTIINTNPDIKLIMSLSPLGVFPPENATATFPMTSDIEGRIAPARTAAEVPKKRSILSGKVRKLKNFRKETDRIGCFTEVLS
jgi:hypothetical protein